MLGRREILQTEPGSGYHTMPPSLTARPSDPAGRVAAAVLGVALLAAGVLVGLAQGGGPAELFTVPAVAWKTTPVVQRAALPLSSRMAYTPLTADVRPAELSSSVGGALARSYQGALPAVAALLAGFAVAVAALASRLRPRVPASPAPVSMAAVTSVYGHQDLEQVPAVFGKDTDPTCLRRRWEAMLRKGQESIVKAIEECDGEGKFRADAWVREGGGGGVSRVMAGGKVWEKAGIGLSVIYGTMPTETINAARQRQANYANKALPAGEKLPFFACGLSCVMHPRNPHCPTMHFNYRYFETEAGDWWFGGGTDITPAYLNEEDMKHFHEVYKGVCDKHDPEFYAKFKKWADEYFIIKHRGETRGLGGIFFDDLNDRDPEKIFAFAEECLNNVVAAYVPIIEKHKNDSFTEEQKRWQLLRRGRYVEFNLVYDRGTIFGLKTGIGRTESILMTLPEIARWEYNHQPEPGSEEEKIMKLFKQPREWV